MIGAPAAAAGRRRPAGLLVALALGLGACGGAAAPPGTARDCSVVVFYQAEGALPQRLSVVGDFNDWIPGRTPMEPAAASGLFVAVLQLPPGWQAYRIDVDGETVLDAYNPLTILAADGAEASVARVGDCAVPELAVTGLTATAAGELEAEVAFRHAVGGRGLDPTRLEVTVDGQAAAAGVDAADGIAVTAAGLAAGKHRLRVAARDRAGTAAAPLEVPFWVEAAPFDWRDALIYQIVVDRFRRGDGVVRDDLPLTAFRGGDLAGVTAAIEEGYFDDLGVNALWVSPLYQNPEGSFPSRSGHDSEAYHGYWPSAPRTVSTRFGGAAALDALVAAAHARGLRVLMDAVLNHVHESHEYFRDHRLEGWFNHADGSCVCGTTCSWGADLEDCWFESFLPDLRWGSPPVVTQLVDDAVFWLDRFDLDGLRVDAVPMMPRLAIRHLRDAVAHRLEQGGTHVYLLGETYTGLGGQPSIRYYLGPQGLSGQFDYPVMWALRGALTGASGLDALDTEVRRSEAAWAGSGAVMAPILGNHDVPRLISELAGAPLGDPWGAPPPDPTSDRPYQLAALAFTFLLTQPGAPVIYYGDEVGLPGAGDPDNRRTMRFGADLDARAAALQAHVGRLGRARRCAAALRRGTRRTLLAEPDLYVYSRDAGEGAVAVVALNRAALPAAITVTLPADLSVPDDAPLGDLFGAAATVTGRQVAVTVPALGAVVLLGEQSCGGE